MESEKLARLLNSVQAMIRDDQKSHMYAVDNRQVSVVAFLDGRISAGQRIEREIEQLLAK